MAASNGESRLRARRARETRTQLADIKALLTTQADQAAPSDPLGTRIIAASRLVDDGLAQGALNALDRIQKEEGDKVSGRNLFRLRQVSALRMSLSATFLRRRKISGTPMLLLQTGRMLAQSSQ